MNKSHSEVASIAAWYFYFLYHTIQHTLTALLFDIQIH